MKKEFTFKKNYKKSFILFTVLFVILGLMVLLVFSFAKESSLEKQRNQHVDKFSVFLNLQFENIENIVTLADNSNWVSEISAMNKSEMATVGPLEKREYCKFINQYNAILGMKLQLMLYFINSGHMINNNMLWDPNEKIYPMDEVLNNIISWVEASYDKYDINQCFFPQSDNFLYAKRTGDVVYICLVNKSLIAEESYFVEKDEGLMITAGEKILYLQGHNSQNTIYQQSVRNLQISTTYFYRFHFRDYAVIFFSVVIGSLLVYFAIYILIEKFLFYFYIKVKSLNSTYGLSLNVKEKSLFSYFTETVQSIIQKEDELSKSIESDLKETKVIYYKMLLSNLSGVQSETEKLQKYLKIDHDVYFTIAISANTAMEISDLIKINEGVYLCEQRDFPNLPGKGWGIGNTYREATGISRSYREAIVAAHNAVMYGYARTDYSELVFTKEKYLAKDAPKIKTLISAGNDAALDAVCELFAKLKNEIDFAVVLAEIKFLYEALGTFIAENHLEKGMNFTWLTLDEAECCAVSQTKLVLEAINKKQKSRAVTFEKIKVYTDQNLFECSLSLKSIAAKFGCSVSYISRLFSENGEKNYVDYVNEKRIERAVQILETGSEDVLSTVAKQCGYYSILTFRRVFQKYKKVTPGKYRELHKK